jgi:tyrosyl-tRNA synthetase
MSDFGEKLIKGMEQFAQDLKDGKPLKVTTVGKIKLAKLLQELGLTVSMSEGRRIVAQGAVKLNDVLKTDMSEDVFVRDGDKLEVGRKKFVLDLTGGFTPKTAE